nr:hypothetical protein [Tanacetum cinerariifolium]
MAMHTQPAMSPGLSAKVTEVMTLSPSSFRKRYRSSYETPSPLSSPTLPIRKRYRGTSKLVKDTKDESSDLDTTREGLEDEGPGSEDEGPSSEEEEATPDGQQQTVPVMDTVADEPLGSVLEQQRAEETLALRSTIRATWSSGSLQVSPSSQTVPTLVALPATTPTTTIAVDDGEFLEVGAQLKLHGSILHDHTQRLHALPPALFEGYDRDLRELYTRPKGQRCVCMRTRSSSNLVGESSHNPTSSNSKRQLLRAPTEGYVKAIVVPSILAEHFELKHSLINMMTSDQFFELEKDNPHDHIRAAHRWLEKEPPRSILTWEDLVSKFINEFFPSSRTTNLRNEISNFQQRFDESFHEAWDRYKDLLRACPHHGFTKLHQLDTFYNALNPADQDSLNSVADGNLLERPKLTHAVNQQTSAVTTAMNAILKQFQATPPPALIKAVEEICVTCGGAHPYYQCLTADGNTFSKFWDNIQGYVSAVAVNYNQGNIGYRPPGVANQIRPSGFAQPNVQNNQNRFSQPQGYHQGNNFNQDSSYQAPMKKNQVVPLSELEKIKKMNKINIKAMQTQINNVKNELRNEIKTLIQASMSNQTNELKNIMGELKAITTRSGLVLDGPSVPMPPLFINPEEDERVEETLTDPKLDEDPLHPNIPYPSRMHKQKQQNKDEIQIHKFWQMFKQLHINITLADALIPIPKYQKMLKALLFNEEKLLELENKPFNENCSAVILKKLPEKLGDHGKFLIPCSFGELKCKALTDLGASINLMPLSVWKKLGLPELISTRMTLELANGQFVHRLELQEMSLSRLESLHSPLLLSLLIMRSILESPSYWEDLSYRTLVL